ncbi:MAG: peptidase, partial [bacterium]
MAKHPKICHDRVLPQELFRQQPRLRPSRGGPLRAVFEFRKMWVNGSSLHVRFLEGTASQKELVKTQARWWTRHANLTFVFDDSPDAEIRIAFDPDDGAWSWVGTDCRRIPQG